MLASNLPCRSRLALVIGGALLWLAGATLHAQTSGSLDTTFDPGAGANDSVLAAAVLDDGRIVLGGKFTAFNGTACGHLIRLDTDGGVDATFQAGTGADGTVEVLGVQADGKILVGGGFTMFNGIPRTNLARLNADGSLDTTFDPGGTVNDVAYALLLQNDGRILVGISGGLFRLNTDGSVDPAFQSPADRAYDASAYTLALQSDGKILVGGYFSRHDQPGTDYPAGRINADGSLDETFTYPVIEDPSFLEEFVNVLDVEPNGMIDCFGGDYSLRLDKHYNFFKRLGASGGEIGRFGAFLNYESTNGSFDDNVYAFLRQSNGKGIVGGNFSHAPERQQAGVVRLNPDGNVDEGFDTSAGVGQGAVDCLAFQKDGKIIVGGEFGEFAGVTRHRVARIYGRTAAPAAVNVAAGGNGLAVRGGSNGKVVVTRAGGDTASPLIVRYKVKGTAVAGVDYKGLPGVVEIPVGATKAKIKIKPVADSTGTGTRKVAVVVLPAPDGGYEIGSKKAKIKIVDP